MTNDTELPYFTEARNLAVIFDANLSWSSHFPFISQRVHYKLHKLKFHRQSLSQLQHVNLSTLTFSDIDYFCVVCSDLTGELGSRLRKLLNCDIRFIFDSRSDVHITPYRHRLEWLSVSNHRLHFGAYAYRIRHGDGVPYLNGLFSTIDPEVRRSNGLPCIRLTNIFI